MTADIFSQPVLVDYHVHSCFSDGKDEPEDIVLEAISKGMKVLGFSDHAFAVPDLQCCIPEEKMGEYRQTILALKEKYKDRIQICLGFEADYASPDPRTPECEYIIGSVHYLETPEGYFSVDDCPEILQEAMKKAFHDDPYALCERYYEMVGEIQERTHCDIIGHFDLVSKMNELRFPFFDETHPRYRAAWKRAADRLLLTGKPFEINTGAISRGYRTVPYPSAEILSYLKTHGARFLLSSDSHRKENLLYEFDKWQHLPETELLTYTSPLSFSPM